jgi:co-chaperonin GroES (HSP10)
VLVLRIADPERIGSIYMPDVSRDRAIKGQVIAVGPECAVQPGQQVYFNSKWNDFAEDYETKTPLGHDDRLHLIQEADIFGIITDA